MEMTNHPKSRYPRSSIVLYSFTSSLLFSEPFRRSHQRQSRHKYNPERERILAKTVVVKMLHHPRRWLKSLPTLRESSSFHAIQSKENKKREEATSSTRIRRQRRNRSAFGHGRSPALWKSSYEEKGALNIGLSSWKVPWGMWRSQSMFMLLRSNREWRRDVHTSSLDPKFKYQHTSWDFLPGSNAFASREEIASQNSLLGCILVASFRSKVVSLANDWWLIHPEGFSGLISTTGSQ